MATDQRPEAIRQQAEQKLPMCDVQTERCCSDIVRRVTEEDHAVWNGVEVSPGAFARRVYYECPTCGRRLKVLNG